MQNTAAQIREYETIYILNPEMPDANAKDFMLKMKEVVEKEGGKNIKVDCQGRKRLAWLRNNHQRGLFVHHRYVGPSGIVKEFERMLAIEEAMILRQSKLMNSTVELEKVVEEQDRLDPPVVRERREVPFARDDRGDYGRGGYGRDFDRDDD